MGVAVGAIMLVIAIDVIVRYPNQLRSHLLLGAISSTVLAAAAAYDVITGHARTTRAFTAYVARDILPRFHGTAGTAHEFVARLFAIWQVWFTTGPGIYLAFAAAGLGLLASFIAAGSIRSPGSAV